jgi:hypothetical protein
MWGDLRGEHRPLAFAVIGFFFILKMKLLIFLPWIQN